MGRILVVVLGYYTGLLASSFVLLAALWAIMGHKAATAFDLIELVIV